MIDRFVVTGLIVLVANAQGKLRQVPLTLKQSTRVRRFVSKLHEGAMHLAPEDLILLTEADALEAFGKLTGKLPFRERMRRIFRRIIGLETERPTSNAQRPTPNDGEPNLKVLPRLESAVANASEK